jgi:hypothetical protein
MASVRMGYDGVADRLRRIVGHLCRSDLVLFSRHGSGGNSVTEYEGRIEAALSALQQQQADPTQR